MYLARFSYDVLPVNRRDAIGFICVRSRPRPPRPEGTVACADDPATWRRCFSSSELARLDQLDHSASAESAARETANWMRAFSEISPRHLWWNSAVAEEAEEQP